MCLSEPVLTSALDPVKLWLSPFRAVSLVLLILLLLLLRSALPALLSPIKKFRFAFLGVHSRLYFPDA